MKKALLAKAVLAAVVLLAASPTAWAVQVLIPNGDFATDPNPPGGFTQTITNWTVVFSGAPAGTPPSGPLPLNQQSGLFTSYGKFNTGATGQYAMITNLGGGTTTLSSGAVGNNFFVNDRQLRYSYAVLTNDPLNASTHDNFRVHIDFYGSAVSTLVTGVIDVTVPYFANQTDTGAGSPFSSAANGATNTFNNIVGNAFSFSSVDISAFFGSFARVSFIVENNGPVGGTNGNGLGVTGVLLDNVLLTPEPSSIAMFAIGAFGLGGFAWRRRTAKKPAAA